MKIDKLKFTPVSDEFLTNFKAPKTVKIYDYENDRASTLNKFLFTEEKLIVKDQEKEAKIQEIEEKIHAQGKKLDEQNRNLFKHTKKDMYEQMVKNKERSSFLESSTKTNVTEVIFKEGFSNTIFKEVKYKGLDTLSNDDIEAYRNLGVSIEKSIPQDEIDSLKQKLDKKIITIEEYKEEYKKLEEVSFQAEVSENYLEPLLKTFFNKIKPSATIKDLEWLHERFIFMPEDPRRRINEKEDESLLGLNYKRNYTKAEEFTQNHADRNFSLVEGLATEYFTNKAYFRNREFAYLSEKHKPKNGPDTIIEPIYNMDFPKRAMPVLLEGGVAHIFRDHPTYLLHLNHQYNNRFWLRIKENREYLASGYNPDSFSDNIVKRSKLLDVKGKSIFDVKNYEEIETMNLSKDEKFDLFLKVLYMMDSNPVKERLTPNEYNLQTESATLDFSKANKYNILEYFRKSNELNPTNTMGSNGVRNKRRNKIEETSNRQEAIGATLDGRKLDLSKDFYLVHSLYNHIYKKFDFDREIQSKAILKNYWDNLVKPWLNIEESRNTFFFGVRHLVKQDLDLAKSVKYTFFNEQKEEIVNYMNTLFNKYSIDARRSKDFDADIEPEILSREIIDEVMKAILNAEYKTSKERNHRHERYGFDWKNNAAIGSKDIEEVFKQTDIKTHYFNEVKKGIESINTYYKYQMAIAGEQGKKIFDATILFAIERFTNTDLYPSAINPVSLFTKNTKVYLEDMIKRYNDPSYITREQPPYFPSIRHLVENWNIDLEKDELHPLYAEISKEELIEKLGSNEVFETREASNKLPNQGLYGIESKHINPLNNIAYQMMLQKERSFETHSIERVNENQSTLADGYSRLNYLIKMEDHYTSVRNKSIQEFNDILKEFIDSKVENHSIENTIDKEKMIQTMQTIVMMSKDFRNKDKIIDLSNVENITEELSKLDGKLSGLNDITKAGMILNYVFTMNELYKKNSVDKNEFTIDTLDIDKAKAMVLQNLIEVSSTSQNGILNELKDGYIKDAIVMNENFNLQHDNSIKDKFDGLEVFNGKHFPLFVDLETLTIFSVEWTTRYPTLNIVVLPEAFAKLEMDNNKERKDDLIGLESKSYSGDKMSYPKIQDLVKTIDSELNLEENKTYLDFHDLNKNNVLDRIANILGTIQTNYILQLEQGFDKALFADVDPLMIEGSTPNSGAVPFMNKYDFEIFKEEQKTDFEMLNDSAKYFDKYNFKNTTLPFEQRDLSPFNFRDIYEEDGQARTVMFKKINGFPYERSTKGDLITALKKINKNDELGLVYDNENKYEIEELPSENLLKSTIIGLISTKMGQKNETTCDIIFKRKSLSNLEAYKQEFHNMRLFETRDELETYKEKHNSIMNKNNKDKTRDI